MRLSEKSIELNFCAQLGQTLRRRIIWFGLTQKQEATAGFDAYARLGGQLLILQFKASSHRLKNGRRRFQAPHHQLTALRTMGQERLNSVFYVFPNIGTSLEFSRDSDLIRQCQFLDAGRIPTSVSVPIGRRGTPRVSGNHYIDVAKGTATIHSEPTDVRLVGPTQLLEAPERPILGVPIVDRIVATLDGEESWFTEMRHGVTGNAIGAVILPLTT